MAPASTWRNPHQFCHTFAHQWLAEGGAEVDLMCLAGVAVAGDGGRYGASAADARAREAHRRGCRPVIASSGLRA